MEKIKVGEFEGTVYNNAFGKGDVIAKMAYSLGRYQKLPDDITMVNGKYYFVPYEKVDITNVEEYLDRAVY